MINFGDIVRVEESPVTLLLDVTDNNLKNNVTAAKYCHGMPDVHGRIIIDPAVLDPVFEELDVEEQFAIIDEIRDTRRALYGVECAIKGADSMVVHDWDSRFSDWIWKIYVRGEGQPCIRRSDGGKQYMLGSTEDLSDPAFAAKAEEQLGKGYYVDDLHFVWEKVDEYAEKKVALDAAEKIYREATQA